MNIDYTYPKDFPKGYGHTSIHYLKTREGYNDAKNGCQISAQSVVKQCIKRNRIEKIKRLYPNAVLLPILGLNKIPLALAKSVDLLVCESVYLIQPIKRKKLNAMQRLLIKPTFYITYLPINNYIIVDDIVTQGGTVSALRKCVIKLGSNVVAVLALAYAIGCNTIAPKDTVIEMINIKFDVFELRKFLDENKIVNNFMELTNSQCRYLLRFKCIENMVRKVESVKLGG